MGPNHLSWACAVRADGVEFLPGLLEREGASTGLVAMAAWS